MPQLVVGALLFDLDGTLVDSTASVQRNWRRLADKMGVPFADIEDLIHGIPARQVVPMIEPDATSERIEELSQFLLEGESTDTGDVVALPGAAAALDGLPTDRWAVVTSGSTRLATARITAAGLPFPRNLITADDVAVGKPDPAPYLAGAALLGVRPQQCLVFEDAPAGVASARAAGTKILGLLTTHPELGQQEGIPTIVSFEQVQFSADRLGVIVTY
jgi:mannitol-1-/sugar-/sorbitol-6-phosphatase